MGKEYLNHISPWNTIHQHVKSIVMDVLTMIVVRFQVKMVDHVLKDTNILEENIIVEEILRLKHTRMLNCCIQLLVSQTKTIKERKEDKNEIRAIEQEKPKSIDNLTEDTSL